jgi:hypothetical protein
MRFSFYTYVDNGDKCFTIPDIEAGGKARLLSAQSGAASDHAKLSPNLKMNPLTEYERDLAHRFRELFLILSRFASISVLSAILTNHRESLSYRS